MKSHIKSIKDRSTHILIAVLTVVLLASCGTAEQFVLMNDVRVPDNYPVPQRHDLTIKRGDELQILVAHRVPKVIEVFNQRISSIDTVSHINSYTVSSAGYITMPVFDSVSVVGMTCKELEKYLVNRMDSEGIAHGASVSVKILNFKVTVIGETTTGVYSFEEGATLFDLMAKTGMLSDDGDHVRRDKVMVMRDCDTAIVTDYLNFLSTDVIYSPYYYLQQNDVFYIYPSKTAIYRSNQRYDFWLSRWSIVTSTISFASSILSIIMIYNYYQSTR